MLKMSEGRSYDRLHPNYKKRRKTKTLYVCDRCGYEGSSILEIPRCSRRDCRSYVRIRK